MTQCVGREFAQIFVLAFHFPRFFPHSPISAADLFPRFPGQHSTPLSSEHNPSLSPFLGFFRKFFFIAGNQMGLWHARHFTWSEPSPWQVPLVRAWARTIPCRGTRRPSHCSRLWLLLRTSPQSIVPASGEKKEACSHKQGPTHTDWHAHVHVYWESFKNDEPTPARFAVNGHCADCAHWCVSVCCLPWCLQYFSRLQALSVSYVCYSSLALLSNNNAERCVSLTYYCITCLGQLLYKKNHIFSRPGPLW